jgi:hypothetical protein
MRNMRQLFDIEQNLERIEIWLNFVETRPSPGFDRRQSVQQASTNTVTGGPKRVYMLT